MANKRMFSVDIVKSDAFLSLSYKGQALYLQCVMSADDDGMIDTMRSILLTMGLKRKDLDELLRKKFILDLDDEIYCVKHWWINNKTIQSDRYRRTNYPEKLERLIIKGNKAYSLKTEEAKHGTEMSPERTQNDSKMDSKCIQSGLLI